MTASGSRAEVTGSRFTGSGTRAATAASSTAAGAPMAAADSGSFEGVLFHLEKSADYFVESNGVHSSTFKIDVVELPTVDHLVLEYRFPSYTGLQPRTVDPGVRV